MSFQNNMIRSLDRMRPDELGLSPLDCGRCGEKEIYQHPCPECGYDLDDVDKVYIEAERWD